MIQYLVKSALVTWASEELKLVGKLYKETMSDVYSGKIELLKKFLFFLNTLEVKEMESEDTAKENSAQNYKEQELHLHKGWINAPSSLQPFHDLHGRNVIITKIGDKCKVVLLKDLSTMSQFEIDPQYLAFGDWNKSRPSEFEFELFGMRFKRVLNEPSVESPCRQCWFCNPTGDGCCLSHQFSDVLPCQEANGNWTTHFERTDLKY